MFYGHGNTFKLNTSRLFEPKSFSYFKMRLVRADGKMCMIFDS